MRTVAVKQYRFSELSNDAQCNAIEKNRYYHVEDMDWWESVYQDANNIGLNITGFELDRSREITGTFDSFAHDTLLIVLNEHGPGDDTYKTCAEFAPQFQIAFTRMRLRGYSEEDIRCNFYDEFEDLVEDFKKALLRNYWDMLQKEMDYLTSDEAVVEALGDHWFDEDGNLV